MNDDRYQIAAQLRGERAGEFPSLRDKLREMDKSEPKDAGVFLATNYGFKVENLDKVAHQRAARKSAKKKRNAKRAAQRIQRRAA
jgi:hypothetical protein